MIKVETISGDTYEWETATLAWVEDDGYLYLYEDDQEDEPFAAYPAGAWVCVWDDFEE